MSSIFINVYINIIIKILPTDDPAAEIDDNFTCQKIIVFLSDILWFKLVYWMISLECALLLIIVLRDLRGVVLLM